MGNEGQQGTPPRIRGYDIVRAAGSGGLGRVWLGVQKALSRQVAIKVIELDADESDPRVQRFLRDARLMAQLEHPNIVAIIEAGRSDDGRWFYAMPYLPNGDLRALVGRATPNDVRKIGVQLLSALEHAHAAGLTHRDLKPKAILLDRAGRPMLSDFGLGLTLREASAARGDTVSGLRYRSPEDAAGAATTVAGEAYSLAAMLYELLTGRLPYSDIGDTGEQGPLLPPSVQHWRPWFQRALARDPAARYDGLATMREALQSLPADGIIPPVWVSPPAAAVAPAPSPVAPSIADADAAVASAVVASAAAVAPSGGAAAPANNGAQASPPGASNVPIANEHATIAMAVITPDAGADVHATIDDDIAHTPRSTPFDMAPVGGARAPDAARHRPIWWMPAVAVLALLAIGAPFLVRRLADRDTATPPVAGNVGTAVEANAIPVPTSAAPSSAAAAPAPARTSGGNTPTAAAPAVAQPKPLADVVRSSRPAPGARAAATGSDDDGARDDAPRYDRSRDLASRDRGAPTWIYRNDEFEPPIPQLILRGDRRDQVDAIRDHLRAGRDWFESERDRSNAQADYLRGEDREEARVEFEHTREAYERWREDVEALRADIENRRGPLD